MSNSARRGAGDEEDGHKQDLYNVIRNFRKQQHSASASVLLRVNSRFSESPVAAGTPEASEPVPRDSPRGANVVTGRGDEDVEENTQRASKPEEVLSTDDNVKEERMRVNVDDGAIKIHCLASDTQFLVPETHKNEPAFGIPSKKTGNYTRPRTALVVPQRSCISRPTSAVSVASGISGWTSLCSTRRPSTVNSLNSAHAEIQPASGRSTRTRGSEFSNLTEESSRLTPRIMLNTKSQSKAVKEDRELRLIFQLPPPFERTYEQWSVGTEDPTEEGRKLRELSQSLFQRETRLVALDHRQEESEYKYYINYGRILDSLTQFVLLPAPPGFMVKCLVTRTKIGIDGKLFPTYFMHLERRGQPQIFLLAAKRITMTPFKAKYVMSTNPANYSRKSSFCVGLLEANLRGSEFVLRTPAKKDYIDIDDGEKEDDNTSSRMNMNGRSEWDEILNFSFNRSVMGTKGPRRTSTKLAKLKSDWERCYPGPFAEAGDNWTCSVKNKTPTWNPSSNRYTLNFNERVQASSVKNFQLFHPSCDVILMQFGRLEKPDAYILDYMYPFCPLQAFAVALCNFDSKPGLD